MAKSINYDNILKEISKGSIDDQIEVFNKLKNVISDRIIEEAEKHEQRQNQLLEIKDKINR